MSSSSQEPSAPGNLLHWFHLEVKNRDINSRVLFSKNAGERSLLEGNKDHLLSQAKSELMKQEHQVGSLNHCISELQQHACAQRLEEQDAQHGYIESRREQVRQQEELSMKEKVLRGTLIRSMHEMGGGGGGGATHLMTESPSDILHSKVWRSAPSCTRLCHCRQSRPSCHNQAEVKPSLYVGQLREKQATRETPPSSLRRAHVFRTPRAPKDVCATLKCCSSSLSTPCSWESSRIDQSMDQPSPWDTKSPSVGRERQESVALHTLSNDDI